MPKMTMSFSKGKKSETTIKHNNRSLDPNFDFDKTGNQKIKRKSTTLNENTVQRNIRPISHQEYGHTETQDNYK
ncbi:hypothetical protein CBF64_05975, partial [Lactobacillus taiwanensis]